MEIKFQKATRKRAKARLAIDGPSGSGKTYTALVAATALAQDGKIAVIDTERGSASLYSDTFSFDVLELDTFSPKLYTEAIQAAEDAGYSVVIIDSLSHAWEGEGGAIDMVDAAAARSKSGNSYTAWRDVTPIHRRMVDAMLQSKCHVIATMRSKTEYAMETNANGKQIPRKIGMAPIQRQGMEYEFTVVADMDLENNMVITKTRFSPWAGVVQNKPNVSFFREFSEWLDGGEIGKPEPAPVVEAFDWNKWLLETFQPSEGFNLDDYPKEHVSTLKASDGKAYMLCTTDKLSKMLNAANKAYDKEEDADAQKEIRRKIHIIEAVLMYRKDDLK